MGGSLVVVAAILIAWYQGSRPTYPDISSPRPMRGLTTAKVVVDEYSDFECPACKAAVPLVKEVIETFGERILFKFHHYPLIQVHTQAFRAAQAAECANDQGKFWEYHDMLYEKQPALSRSDLESYARSLKLDVDGLQGFNACLDSRAKANQVRSDVSEGDRQDVNATPTFFINSEKVVDWSKLKELIQAKLMGG